MKTHDLRGVLAIAVLAALASANADAVTLYKLIDRGGRITYVDAPPKNFDGQVIPIEVDPDTNPAALAAPKAVEKAEPPKVAPTPASDYLAKRRLARAQLEANLEKARRNLEEAKLALANVTMGEDERQVVQRQVDPPPKPADPRADPKTAAKSLVLATNCNKTMRNGKMVTVCGAVVPNEKYFAKVAQLEDAVRKAEEDLAEAERAYRRGVD